MSAATVLIAALLGTPRLCRWAPDVPSDAEPLFDLERSAFGPSNKLSISIRVPVHGTLRRALCAAEGERGLARQWTPPARAPPAAPGAPETARPASLVLTFLAFLWLIGCVAVMYRRDWEDRGARWSYHRSWRELRDVRNPRELTARLTTVVEEATSPSV